MTWIKTVEPGEATGELKQEYSRAVERAGKVFNIFKVQSLNPESLRATRDLYLATLQASSSLSRAGLPPHSEALAKFADLPTRTPAAVRKQDVDTLRKHGLRDHDILDAVEVIAYFNYIKRVADTLGIDPEPEMHTAFDRKKKVKAG